MNHPESMSQADMYESDGRFYVLPHIGPMNVSFRGLVRFDHSIGLAWGVLNREWF